MTVPKSLDIHHSTRWLARRRQRRMRAFIERMKPEPGEIILDVGGTETLWRHAGWTGPVVCLNPAELEPPTLPNVEYIRGNGCAMEFTDQSFSIVFSNSAIEHVGPWGAQQQFADEIRRVGKRWWVQTPNLWFPIEPHMFMPFYQFFPRPLKVVAAKLWPFAWHETDDEEAINALAEIRLLRLSEMRRLFPEGEIYLDRFGPLTKSFCLYQPD